MTSWRRSRLAGVDIDAPRVPYDDAIDRRGRLSWHASPVVERLLDQLNDIPISIALTDAQGRLVERRDSNQNLARINDRVFFAPGFNYAEPFVGTNGIGTALETGRPVFVCGSQHFNERSTRFACAGVPIRNPVTRRIDGLINISSLADDAHPMMHVLAQEAARDIERLALEHSSERQRAVLDAFLAASRRSNNAVLSISDDVVMANSRASALLTPSDQAILRVTAADMNRFAAPTLIEMSLANGNWAQVHCHPISHGGNLAGAVFEVQISETRPARRLVQLGRARAVLPGLVGRSPSWIAASTEVRNAARARRPLLIVGESGVGKLALAQTAHHDRTTAGQLRVLDCRADLAGGLRDLLASPPTTVVLRHLDRLDASEATEAAEQLGRLSGGGAWIVGTVNAEATTPDPLLRHFRTAVTVPPLRHRIDDLYELVPALLRQLAPTRNLDCAPRHSGCWPATSGPAT